MNATGLGLRFLLFWSAQTVSDVGTSIATVAIPIVAVTMLDASTLQVGVITAVEAIPLLVSLLLANWIDRRSQKTVLVFCDICRFAVQAGVVAALATHTLTLPILYAAVFALGSFTAASILAGQSLRHDGRGSVGGGGADRGVRLRGRVRG